MSKLLDGIIRLQQSIPIMLPNEYLAWKKYRKKFTKQCDGCHEDKGVYKITYQDPNILSTVVAPFPVRLCTDCLCEADEKVGIMSEDSDESSFEIERI